MTTITAPRFSISETRLARLFRDIAEGSPLLTRHAAAMLIAFVTCLALPLVDDRIFNGINVWHKPAKFFFSLAVQFGTVAWALSLVAPEVRSRRAVRWPAYAMLAAAWAEMAYIVFRAARGEASHFNGTPLGQTLYNLMGFGALILTVTAAVIGFVIWRNRRGDLWREAAGLGLMLGALLGTAAGFMLGSGTSHWIGGVHSDAAGLPLFFWSTTGGDLRVAHFVGLHAMQIVPFAALTGRRSVVYGTVLVLTLLTIALVMQAQMGIPLFRP